MARPERNNVDYFPFLCEEGKKMFYIEETYGNDGFSVFVKLLRELAKADYHYLNLSEKTTIMFLAAKCKVSTELLNLIITDLVELGKFNELLWNENRVIWCQDFIDSIQDAYSKRKNNCITYDSLLQHLISLGVRKPIKPKSKAPVKPQSIVEESITEEIKTDWDILFIKWFDYKKARKETYKNDDSIQAFKDKLTKISGNNIEVAREIITESMSNNWAGVFPIKKSKSTSHAITDHDQGNNILKKF